MNDLIYNYLILKCVGYDNRVKGQVLMKKFGIKDHKTFRKHIELIRQSPDCPRMIGSKAGQNGGYWIIANKKEFDDTVFHLYARAKEMKKTAKLLQKKAKKEGI